MSHFTERNLNLTDSSLKNYIMNINLPLDQAPKKIVCHPKELLIDSDYYYFVALTTYAGSVCVFYLEKERRTTTTTGYYSSSISTMTGLNNRYHLHRFGTFSAFPIEAICFHPKQEILFLGLMEGRILVWNILSEDINPTSYVCKLKGSNISSLVYHEDHNLLFCGDWQGFLRIYSLTNAGMLDLINIYSFQNYSIYSLKFHENLLYCYCMNNFFILINLNSSNLSSQNDLDVCYAEYDSFNETFHPDFMITKDYSQMSLTVVDSSLKIRKLKLSSMSRLNKKNEEVELFKMKQSSTTSSYTTMTKKNDIVNCFNKDSRNLYIFGESGSKLSIYKIGTTTTSGMVRSINFDRPVTAFTATPGDKLLIIGVGQDFLDNNLDKYNEYNPGLYLFNYSAYITSQLS